MKISLVTSLILLTVIGCQMGGAQRSTEASRPAVPGTGATAMEYTATVPSGLDFPSNGETDQDVRFRFTVPNLIPMYPATYIWRVKLRRQSGYYTTFFWGNDGPFTATSYYGCHPYPDGTFGPAKRASLSHKWELSIDGRDLVDDENGHSTDLEYDVWMTQALRVYDNFSSKVHEFYWDLPDTSKVIISRQSIAYGSKIPQKPALSFGDAPWSLGNERLSGILRGIQLYYQSLPLPDLLAEVASPLATAMGQASIWYLNINPTPDDISDKSGKGHHPVWASGARPRLWADTQNSTHIPGLGR